MPIIGKLIKRTNSISYKRNLKKKNDFSRQITLLKRALNRSKFTAFGMHYDFESYCSSLDVFEQFQKHVPIQDYDALFEKWLHQTLEGKRDITWPGKVKYFALSSGTTGSPSKRIPVTHQMIRSFQKVSVKQLATLHELDLPEEFYQAQILPVGGSTRMVQGPNHMEGDLSGILRKHAPLVASPFTKPEKNISEQSDWNTKLQMMVEKAPEWNIGVLAGVPSWCILLMEKVIEYHGLKSIHDVWPNFHVYVHGGVFMAPYEKRLQRVLGQKVHLIDTYLASEGYFGYQTDVNRKSMKLLLDTGVFFEFVPFTSDYFTLEGDLIDKHAAFSIDEVQPGLDYAIVVSTNAGLWRYLIGDLVQFTDIEKHEIILTGRIKQFLSLCGEHLSLDNINTAIDQVAREENIEITEFTIVAHEEELTHHWFIGTTDKVDAKALMQKIDDKIKALNDDYRSCRKVSLKDPMISLLVPQDFYEYLEKIGKTGSQFKFPRVISKKQKEDWLAFVKNKE